MARRQFPVTEAPGPLISSEVPSAAMAEILVLVSPSVEKITGLDLPDDKIDAVVDAVKAKIGLDSIGDKLKGLGGLFGKK